MSNTQQMYNIGTTVFYAGDDINEAGYGTITEQVADYLDELQLKITLEDGRVVHNVTAADFEQQSVLGNIGMAEFKMVDTWEDEIRGWEEDSTYHEEISAWSFSL